MADGKSKEITVTQDETKTVSVQSYSRKPPTMHGFKKVTVKETRTTTYEK